MAAGVVKHSTVTKRKLKQMNGRAHSSPGGARGRMRIVSYCPHCPSESPASCNPARPETNPQVVCQTKTKVGSCKNGHKWKIHI